MQETASRFFVFKECKYGKKRRRRSSRTAGKAVRSPFTLA